MGIALNVSNHLEPLAIQLSRDFSESEKTVFSKCYVVTQTDGMNAWLKYKLAEEIGITANIEFLKPNDLIGLLYNWVKGYQKPVMTIEMLQWAIFSVLDSDACKIQFPDLTNYYIKQPVKQMALATKLADLFDQYQMYRQDLLRAWEQSIVANEDEAFQAYLWLQIHLKHADSLVDKSTAIQTIIQALKQDEHKANIQSKLNDIYFFGLAVITPQHIHLFHELSAITNLKLYLLNPAPAYYWWEDKSEKEIVRMTQKFKRDTSKMNFGIIGNDILNNWGKVIKDTFYTLFQDETYINVYNDDLAVEPSLSHSLLEKIQHDVYLNAVNEQRQIIRKADIEDESILINACYTPYREVEALYNYLVKLVDEGKLQSSRDVVVMVSDIEAYAPYIKAVFNHAPYKFPFTIADEKMQNEHSLLASISSIMAFEWDDFKAETVMQLIEQPYVQNRFQFSDLDQIRNMIQTANIRFGVDPHVEDGTYVHSWAYGLDRLFYGLMLSGEPEITVKGLPLIPLDVFEGQQQEAVVKLYAFYKQLKKYLYLRQAPRHLDAWCDWLLDLVEDVLFQASEQDDEAYQHLLKIVDRMRKVKQYETIEVSFDVFRFHFLKFLEYETKQKSFASAGITFCSLIPMRSIPFKVVAMLGMNFDQFPRKEQHPSFNLIELHKRKGDRSVKDNDKHLFLETILSAQSNLYISYIGFSVKDGSQLPPSSLVDELLEYILQGCEQYQVDWLKAMVLHHALHGYSPAHQPHSKWRNYLSYELSEPSLKWLSDQIESDNLITDKRSWPDIKGFFTDSFKWYFNKKLLVNYNDEDLLLPDQERSILDHLEAWKLRKTLSETSAQERDTLMHKLQLKGELPLLNAGKMAYDIIVDEWQHIVEPIAELLAHESKRFLSCHCSISKYTLQTEIEVYGEHYVMINTSSSLYAKVFGAWLDYLLLRSCGHAVHFVYVDKKANLKKLASDAMTQEQAIAELSALLDVYAQHQESPFMLPWAYFEKLYNKPDIPPSKHIKDIQQQVDSNLVYTDVYFRKAWEMGWLHVDNIPTVVAQLEKVFKPMNHFLNLVKQ